MNDSPTAFEIQIALMHHGLYPGPIDGKIGPNSKLAIDGYSANNGLSGFSEAEVLAHLVDHRFRHPAWLKRGFAYHGLKEFPGAANNKTILRWFKTINSGWFTTDRTPWCAAYVGAVLEEAGLASTDSARARSYDDYGTPLLGPALGAIVTFWRGSRHVGKGHVGFVVGALDNGDPIVLGGNQGDAVTVAPFKKDRVIGYRWPVSAVVPDSVFCPTLSLRSLGYSVNEA